MADQEEKKFLKKKLEKVIKNEEGKIALCNSIVTWFEENEGSREELLSQVGSDAKQGLTRNLRGEQVKSMYTY